MLHWRKLNQSLKNILYFIKKGWGKDLIERLEKNPLSLVSTFFTPAFMADELKYPGNIFLFLWQCQLMLLVFVRRGLQQSFGLFFQFEACYL